MDKYDSDMKPTWTLSTTTQCISSSLHDCRYSGAQRYRFSKLRGSNFCNIELRVLTRAPFFHSTLYIRGGCYVMFWNRLNSYLTVDCLYNASTLCTFVCRCANFCKEKKISLHSFQNPLSEAGI